MSAPSGVGIDIFIICLLVPFFIYVLVKQIWNGPLRSGPGYFMGVEVPAGFYQGPGRGWIAGYHAMVATLYGAWAVALASIVVSRRWELTPVWAGGIPIPLVTLMFAFQAWTRHKLGVNPPVRPVALALESRRFGDYISWPAEALAVALVAMSWWLLLRGGRHFDWLMPLQLTWAALGMIPGKMAMVRMSWPLPAERTEEHYRLQDASRRFSIRVNGIFFEWFSVILLLGMALLHGLSPAHPAGVWLWLVLAACFAVWGYAVMVLFRGQREMLAMGRDLRPAGSWRTPFGRASWMGMGRAFQTWSVIWCGGIFAFIFYSLWKNGFK